MNPTCTHKLFHRDEEPILYDCSFLLVAKGTKTLSEKEGENRVFEQSNPDDPHCHTTTDQPGKNLDFSVAKLQCFSNSPNVANANLQRQIESFE